MTSYARHPYLGLRRATREVRVGSVGIGGDNPLRVQSMTTTDTRDTRATVEQIARLAEAGCEIVRVTAPSITDSQNLEAIQRELAERGVSVPLVADIHFAPNAAMEAALWVEKVRINPGNYADKKRFEVREYSDAEYAEEIDRVADRFRPLVTRCKERGVAMRIGTNHGSLSDRILNRYGDTPRGMVESALEFLDVCEAERYHDVVFSMKASNTQVAIQAYRLLAARLEERRPGEPGYPFHVGVTEAGDAEDGRIKSAIGIGSLLEDGIGDTIRVSLTEDPVLEVPVASELAHRAEERWAADVSRAAVVPRDLVGARAIADPYAHARRATRRFALGEVGLGDHEEVRVELELAEENGRSPLCVDDLAGLPARLAFELSGLVDIACESLLVCAPDLEAIGRVPALRKAMTELGIDLPLSLRIAPRLAEQVGPVAESIARVALDVDSSCDASLLEAAAASLSGLAIEWRLSSDLEALPELVDRCIAARGGDDVVFSIASDRSTHAVRALADRLCERGVNSPIVLRHARRLEASDERALLDASIDLGASLCDGLGDMVTLSGFASPAPAVDLAYRILQGARLRTTRTEYISCPSCGRTLFDLEQTTARIKQKTDHLKGVKIAIMGCIVNGPGEMADADFGYVGSGPGVVSLYVGHEIVERNVPETTAADRLVELIREEGRWVESSE